MEYKRSVVEYLCEACGKILVGYDHNVLKNESYMSIKGKLTLQLWDEKTQKRHFCHIIPETKTLLTVCDLECLQKYIDFQHIQYKVSRERYLRNQASTPDPNYIPKYPQKRY